MHPMGYGCPSRRRHSSADSEPQHPIPSPLPPQSSPSSPASVLVAHFLPQRPAQATPLHNMLPCADSLAPPSPGFPQASSRPPRPPAATRAAKLLTTRAELDDVDEPAAFNRAIESEFVALALDAPEAPTGLHDVADRNQSYFVAPQTGSVSSAAHGSADHASSHQSEQVVAPWMAGPSSRPPVAAAFSLPPTPTQASPAQPVQRRRLSEPVLSQSSAEADAILASEVIATSALLSLHGRGPAEPCQKQEYA